jgi:hypothetical protein
VGRSVDKKGDILKKEVQEAIEKGVRERRAYMATFDSEARQELLGDLFTNMIGKSHLAMQKWAMVTGQSAQLDTGYLAQFIASIMLQEPGQGFRGKGDDLADGSEVKSAANISGVDRPRWNHSLGTLAEDKKRVKKNIKTKSEELLSSPFVFYLLIDRPSSSLRPVPLRIRAWCLNGQEDVAWQCLVKKFLKSRKKAKHNLQLHPPIGRDDDEVVNRLGNLDFKDVKCFDAHVELGDSLEPKVVWNMPPIPKERIGKGQTKSLAYRTLSTVGADVKDLVADLGSIQKFFSYLPAAAAKKVEVASVNEVTAEN